ncbi:protein [Lentinula edodes]|uniref:Protein n=1 Tax=Lentinula edodes TaxID=5353 RepID=A0A1Q3EPF6_LENED|nr:protein [Lentinula edodes]
MGPTAIANAEYGVDFYRERYGDEWSTHFCYVDGESKEFNGNLFGEIMGEGHGTAVGAQGSHFFGNEKSSTTNVKEIVKEIVSEYRSDAITLTGPLLYTVAQRNHNTHPEESFNRNEDTSKLKKRKLDSLDPGQKDIAGFQAVDGDAMHYPTESSIQVGALYNYNLMPDYGGNCFALNNARLIQPDWRKIDDTLIVPWKNYLQLRPGTVVVANVSLRMHVLQPKDKRQQKRKVYQAIVNFLKVVAESDIPVVKPSAPIISQTRNKQDTPAAAAESSAVSVLRSIGLTRSTPSSVHVGTDGESNATAKPAKRIRSASTVSKTPLKIPEEQHDFTQQTQELSSLEYMNLDSEENMTVAEDGYIDEF